MPDDQTVLDQLGVKKLLVVHVHELIVTASNGQLSGTATAGVYTLSADDSSLAFIADIALSRSADSLAPDSPHARRFIETSLEDSLSRAAASLFYDHAASPKPGSL